MLVVAIRHRRHEVETTIHRARAVHTHHPHDHENLLVTGLQQVLHQTDQENPARIHPHHEVQRHRHREIPVEAIDQEVHLAVIAVVDRELDLVNTESILQIRVMSDKTISKLVNTKLMFIN